MENLSTIFKKKTKKKQDIEFNSSIQDRVFYYRLPVVK